LGYFGSTLHKSKMNNSNEANQKLENQEVERMICEIIGIHKINNVTPPAFLEEAVLVNTLYNTRYSNKTLYNSIVESLEKENQSVPSHNQPFSAKRVVILLKEYYKNKVSYS
jgi:hypothetical protein